jgi:hypothetical protein
MATVFSDPLRRRLLLLFAAQPRSIAQVAALSGMDLKRLHYHVTVLHGLGLLTIAHRQRRGGRPIKFYKTAADAFFVPAELAPLSQSRALENELRDALSRLREHAREGTLYRLGDGPQMRMMRHPATDNADGAEYWRVLRLSRADAAQLATQIDDCLTSYRTRDAVGSKEYLIHFAFAPRRAEGRSKRPRR